MKQAQRISYWPRATRLWSRAYNIRMSTALITGASGGIGYELAKLFARDRHNLILVARSRDKLADAATELRALGVNVHTHVLDLAAPAAPKFLWDQVQAAGVIVDILVN